jgi:exoribonuclease R
MPVPTTNPDAALVERAFDRQRQELGVRTTFPPDVLQAAEEAARRQPATDGGYADQTHLPFVTVDPPGSRDLDQALYLQRSGSGLQVWYAIADVAFWVDRDGPIEREAWLRGETMYAPDQRDSLYPPTLSEGAASLLPDAVKPAVLFGFRLGARAEIVAHTVQRALVRSRAQLTYQQVLQHVEGGGHTFAGQPWSDSLLLLKPFAEQRRQREAERGGVSLPILTQHVSRSAAARLGYQLTYEEPNAAEDWTSHVSLLTGHAAALRMLDARVGLLRVLPPAAEEAIEKFRHVAAALGFAWPTNLSYADFIRSRDRSQPNVAALVWQAPRVMRGADYLAFDGTVPIDPIHHALAMEYAHCTAPLRRLADRYVLDLLVELADGKHPTAAERARLPELAHVMNDAETRSRRLDRAVVDVAEAWMLKDRIGQRFPATVLDVHNGRVEVQVEAPPVRAEAERGAHDRWLDLGESVSVKLTVADVEQGRISFELAES